MEKYLKIATSIVNQTEPYLGINLNHTSGDVVTLILDKELITTGTGSFNRVKNMIDHLPIMSFDNLVENLIQMDTYNIKESETQIPVILGMEELDESMLIKKWISKDLVKFQFEVFPDYYTMRFQKKWNHHDTKYDFSNGTEYDLCDVFTDYLESKLDGVFLIELNSENVDMIVEVIHGYVHYNPSTRVEIDLPGDQDKRVIPGTDKLKEDLRETLVPSDNQDKQEVSIRYEPDEDFIRLTVF